ncbi:GNAT family N-acetyltransferase [Propionibacterium sp.]|uniref:GNAT family N-acetyltransferase n=1 Tax=Propionibacterium sp. TaxID=1977903 RepID=UPI0039ED5E39
MKQLMRGRVRPLGQRDLLAVRALLDRDPVCNVFVSSRLDIGGLNSAALGCKIYGFERDGGLVSLCHAGANLVPVGYDEEAFDAFTEKLGPRRFSQSIMGAVDCVDALYQRLSMRWGDAWGQCREKRMRQPVMSIEGESPVPPDVRVQPASVDIFESYFHAAVRMHTEEVGVSPLDPAHSYETYVMALIRSGRAFAGYDADTHRTWFKADIGCAHGRLCQVQGVWVDPELRGRGLSIPAMAQVVRLCRKEYPVVTLYVNDFNTRARRLYEHVGFQTVAELATILY